MSTIMASGQDYNIPDWIKNNAGWWADGQIPDSAFVNGIKFLIENGIMEIESSQSSSQTSEVSNFQDNGDFYLIYKPTDEYSNFEYWLKEGYADFYFDYQIEWLNSSFKLPYDVGIIIDECDMVNAWYDPGQKQVTICYELIDDMTYKFFTYYADLSDRDGIEMPSHLVHQSTLNAIDHTFYHELGHAFVDIYDLPITGLEEDAVDQFGVYILIETSGNIGQDAVADTAIYYYLGNEQNPAINDTLYADEHSLDKQRFFNFACWVYGSDPEYNQFIIDGGWFPNEYRTDRCTSEYERVSSSWETLLEPYWMN